MAQYLTRQEINAQSGLLKQLEIGPDEAAVLVRNGRVEDTLTQQKMKMGGGFVGWLANKLGGGEDLRVLFVRTAPIDLQVPFGGASIYQVPAAAGAPATVRQGGGLLTKDNQLALGSVRIRFSFDVNNAVKVLNFIRTNAQSPGRPGQTPPTWLSLWDISARFQDEIVGNVLKSIVRERDYKDLSGNVDVSREIDATMLSELRKSFDTFGITLNQVITKWDTNEYDRVRAYAGQQELRERAKDITFSSQMGDERRRSELAASRDEFDAQLRIQQLRNTKLMAQLQEEVLDIHASSKANREMEEHSRNLQKQASAAKVKQDIARTEDEDDFNQIKRLSELQQGRQQAAAAHQLELEKNRATLEIEKARLEAEGKKYDLDTYERGMDKTLDHAAKMAKVQAEMVAAAKQNVPTTLVQGGGGVSTRMNVDATPERNAKGEAEELDCPNCGEPIRATWKVCPDCGKSLKGPSGGTCAKCNTPLKPRFKVCPECGAPVAPPSATSGTAAPLAPPAGPSGPSAGGG